MGLAERREVKKHQEETVPTLEQELEEICGVRIPYEVDWDSFARDGASLGWVGTTSGFQNINDGLREVCRDDLGKEAVRESIKRIAIENIPDKAENKIEVADEALTVHWAWGKGDDAFSFSYTRVREAVENAL